MHRPALLLALALAGPASASEGDFFSRLDRDQDGYLADGELSSVHALSGPRWAARDRNGDGRIGRDEFWPHGDAEPQAFTARQLLGMPVHNRIGERLGEVQDLLFDSRGRVAALELAEGHVLWRQARVGTRYITIAAVEPGWRRPGRDRRAWRATQLLEARARSGLPTRVGHVADLVILPGGQVANVVLRAGAEPAAATTYPAWSRVQFLLPRG